MGIPVSLPYGRLCLGSRTRIRLQQLGPVEPLGPEDTRTHLPGRAAGRHGGEERDPTVTMGTGTRWTVQWHGMARLYLGPLQIEDPMLELTLRLIDLLFEQGDLCACHVHLGVGRGEACGRAMQSFIGMTDPDPCTLRGTPKARLWQPSPTHQGTCPPLSVTVPYPLPLQHAYVPGHLGRRT